MRKITLLASVLAMVLFAASPAFAQVAVDDSVAIDNSHSVSFNAVSQNIVGSIETGDATQNGDATATATRSSVAVATVDADLDTSVSLVNRVGGVGHVTFDDDDDNGVVHHHGVLHNAGLHHGLLHNACLHGGFTSGGVFIDITEHRTLLATTGNGCFVDFDHDGFFGNHEFVFH